MKREARVAVVYCRSFLVERSASLEDGEVVFWKRVLGVAEGHVYAVGEVENVGDDVGADGGLEGEEAGFQGGSGR